MEVLSAMGFGVYNSWNEKYPLRQNSNNNFITHNPRFMATVNRQTCIFLLLAFVVVVYVNLKHVDEFLEDLTL